MGEDELEEEEELAVRTKGCRGEHWQRDELVPRDERETEKENRQRKWRRKPGKV